MADKIPFELVSPERLLFSEAVEMVVIPGAEGNFGVLPGHSPFASTVRADLIEIYEGGQVVRRIFVAGGFAEVTPERVTVLADEAASLDQLDREAIERRIKALEEDVRDLADEGARAAAQAKLGLEHAKLAAVVRAGSH
ncbi:MAG: F0F1 ATP synthase subunit epsilon [Alphaproteobacteria bacterium]|nr:F0F1 ATP synthase subunit epsilon [Alphaproteobacteria bacterium]